MQKSNESAEAAGGLNNTLEEGLGEKTSTHTADSSPYDASKSIKTYTFLFG